MEHDIHEFITVAHLEMQREYNRIQKRATEDPGTAGDQGEENWATLLRKWLPQYFHIVTKGRIITDTGYTSPQLDIIVLSPAYPRILLDKKLYLSGGVVAAFECKTTLKANHIEKALKTSAELKRALPKKIGSPYKELHAGIIYGLLAHSHSWKSDKSNPIENIEKALIGADLKYVEHPRECIDFITVADLASWNVFKFTFMSPLMKGYTEYFQNQYGPNGSSTSGYICHKISANQKENFSPIGTLLSGLFSSLAWNHLDMRSLEEYFRKVNILGSGKGSLRHWSLNIYSEQIKERVYSGHLSNGASYDEWRMGF